MRPEVLTLFDALFLIATIASLVLSVLAIWLALAFKRDADKVNRDTIGLLVDIRTDAKKISEGVMDELRAYGNSMRGALQPVMASEVHRREVMVEPPIIQDPQSKI